MSILEADKKGTINSVLTGYKVLFNDVLNPRDSDNKLLGEKITVEDHSGGLLWAELKRRGFNAPAVFLTCLGWQQLSDNDERHSQLFSDGVAVDARFAAIIITKHAKNQQQRHAAARAIAEQLSTQLFIADIESATQARKIKSETALDASAEEENLSRWHVMWYSALQLSADDVQQVYKEFLRYHATHTVSKSESVEELVNVRD